MNIQNKIGRGYLPELFRQIRTYLQELFRQMRTYLQELFQQIRTYLPELFWQIRTYLPELFQHIRTYLPEPHQQALSIYFTSELDSQALTARDISFSVWGVQYSFPNPSCPPFFMRGGGRYMLLRSLKCGMQLSVKKAR